MKSIKESLLASLNEVRKSDEPAIGDIAYDYYNDPWVIIDFCKVNETPYLKKLMRDYDTGSFYDDYSAGAYDGEAYAVAAHNKDDKRDTALWLWGPEGLWSEKR